jgi:hypothetical protein
MAAITPSADGLALFGSRLHYTRTGVLATGGTETFLANGVTVPANGLKPVRFFFASIGDGDTWSGAPRNTVDVWWKPDDVDDDFVNPYIIQRGGIGRACIVEFQTTGAGKSGWLLCLCKG